MQISPENKSPQVQRFLRKEVSDFHARLVDLLDVQPYDRVLDLGCGRGATLVHLADTISNEGKLVGLDFDQPSLDECGQIFHGIPLDLIQHDLNRSLPFGDGEFTKIVCHNVLECLHDKVAFLNECARVLVPGGVLVLSHSDFDTIVFNSSFTDLTRKLVHNFADATQPWMDTSDAMMGRKLAGIVQESVFNEQRVEGYSVISTELAEFSPGGAFMNDILGAAREANAFDQNELEGWEKEQRQFNEQGKFLYAVTNFIVVAVK